MENIGWGNLQTEYKAASQGISRTGLFLMRQNVSKTSLVYILWHKFFLFKLHQILTLWTIDVRKVYMLRICTMYIHRILQKYKQLKHFIEILNRDYKTEILITEIQQGLK